MVFSAKKNVCIERHCDQRGAQPGRTVVLQARVEQLHSPIRNRRPLDIDDERVIPHSAEKSRSRAARAAAASAAAQTALKCALCMCTAAA